MTPAGRVPRVSTSVVTLTLDEAKCSGCGMCLTVCPHGVFAMKNGRAAIVDRDACMECGACALNFPCEAVRVESGVGCVAAIIKGVLAGSEPDCDCAGGSTCCGTSIHAYGPPGRLGEPTARNE